MDRRNDRTTLCRHCTKDACDACPVRSKSPGNGLLDPCGSIECSITPTAAATASTTTAATVVASTTAAAATLLPWLGLVHRQVPAVVIMTVETLDGRLRLGVGPHLHESEPFGAVGVLIDDDPTLLWIDPNGVNNASRSESLTL